VKRILQNNYNETPLGCGVSDSKLTANAGVP